MEKNEIVKNLKEKTMESFGALSKKLNGDSLKIQVFGPNTATNLWESEIKDSDFKFDDAVYLFFAESKIANWQTLQNERDKVKDKFKISCVNEHSTRKCNCLYVGSTKEMGKRIQEHLTGMRKSTSAMHLSEWLPGLKVSIAVIAFKREENEIMHTCEDLLWNCFRPALGRKGLGPKEM